MKKKTYLIAAIAAAMVLTGCSGAPEETTAPPETTLPPETTVVTTAPPEPTTPTIPWDQETVQDMSYEEYFAELRVYENVDLWASWDGVYQLRQEGTNMIVSQGIKDVLTLDTGMAETTVQWVAADSNWAYGVKDGTDLFRMDYTGETRETLFTAGSAILCGDFSHVSLCDGAVLFFAAADSSGSAVYRLYLPEMKLDTIAETAAQIQMGVPASNHEITWTESNPEFDELYAQILADLPEKYSYEGQPIEDLESWLSKDYQIPIRYIHTINTQTGEESAVPDYGNYYSGPEA